MTHVYLSDNGLIETGYTETGQAHETTFTYSFATDDLAPPVPWMSREGEQVTTENGDDIDRATFSLHTRGERDYRIGDCTFRSIAFQTFARYEDGDSMVEFVYLLDLGIPIPISYATDGVVEVYRPVSIAPAGEGQ